MSIRVVFPFVDILDYSRLIFLCFSFPLRLIFRAHYTQRSVSVFLVCSSRVVLGDGSIDSN